MKQRILNISKSQPVPSRRPAQTRGRRSKSSWRYVILSCLFLVMCAWIAAVLHVSMQILKSDQTGDINIRRIENRGAFASSLRRKTTENGHQQIQLHNSEFKAERSVVADSSFSQQTSKVGTRQRIVMLPGPHKTGTSSIQANLLQWTHHHLHNSNENHNHASKETKATISLLHPWIWPIALTDYPVGDIGSYALESFTALTKKGRTSTRFRDLFQVQFRKLWEAKHSIVFGHEAMDRVLKFNSIEKQNEAIAGLLEILPWKKTFASSNSTNQKNTPLLPPLWGSDETSLTVSITYRSPRVDQLVSVWHEVGQPQQSLSSFLLQLRNESDAFRCALNPLGLAAAFARKGIDTVVIDTSGVKESGIDLTLVVVCNVLGVECVGEGQNKRVAMHDSEKHGGGRKQEEHLASHNEKDQDDEYDDDDDDDNNPQQLLKPGVYNKRSDPGPRDLSSDQLQRMNAVLNAFDCQYQEILTLHPSKVRILYGSDIFSHCRDLDNKQGGTSGDATPEYEVKEMVRQIKAIAAEEKTLVQNEVK